MNRIVLHEGVEVAAALFGDWVAGEEAAEGGGIVAVVVVNEVEFGVVDFGRPLERLRDIAGGGNGAERRVGIRRADVAVLTEDFTDVFRDVVTVGEPVPVFLDCERTRRRRLHFLATVFMYRL